MVRFHWLSGDYDFLQYGGKWISNRQTNGEFDYFFVIEILNWRGCVGEKDAPAQQYHVSLSVVSPSEAGEDNLKSALDCCGLTQDQLDKAGEEGKVEVLYDYGVHSPVWGKSGNNARNLITEAKKYAKQSEFLFGFVMDRPINRIGATGWDGIRGDLTRSLREYQGV